MKIMQSFDKFYDCCVSSWNIHMTLVVSNCVVLSRNIVFLKWCDKNYVNLSFSINLVTVTYFSWNKVHIISLVAQYCAKSKSYIFEMRWHDENHTNLLLSINLVIVMLFHKMFIWFHKVGLSQILCFSNDAMKIMWIFHLW